MAAVDSENRQRDVLPSISHLDLDRIKSERGDSNRFGTMNGLSISTAPLGSPTTIYSGPPPPYSCASSTTGSVHGLSGYISPPESTTRRSTKDEKDSPAARTSLPSIHEALRDRSIPFSTPLQTNSSHQPGSGPPTGVGATFPDAPKGPSNPFSQPISTVGRDHTYTNQSQPAASTAPEAHSGTVTYPNTSSIDVRPPIPQSFSYPKSPRSNPVLSGRPTSFTTSSHPPPLPESSTTVRSPLRQDPPKPAFTFPQYGNSTAGFASTSEQFQFTAGSKFEDRRSNFPRSSTDMSYGDTVKRHLDVFDAELGLKEIGEGSERTANFARVWAGRYHQSNRSGYFNDALPAVHEVDEMLRQSHRVIDHLARIRDVVIAQQTALSEERARLARGSQLEDDYSTLPDEYKGGGFAGGDSKKRRGKAAPPGRCHSCNRAETPEWRRGPDGARTLCNACGLHYAKLTRKMGVNKAAALTGSSLRPKHP